MDKWYTFDSIESFNEWHEKLKMFLGYPLPSLDNDGNVIGEPFTTNYTAYVKVSDNDFRAIVEDKYAENLIECEAPIFEDPFVKKL